MSKNIVILGAVSLLVPLVYLVSSSSLLQGEISVVEEFPAHEQQCNTKHDCRLVYTSYDPYECNYSISKKNYPRYQEIWQGKHFYPCALIGNCDTENDAMLPLCESEASCINNLCSVIPITSKGTGRTGVRSVL